jgi:type IV pilus assembly protein PilM
MIFFRKKFFAGLDIGTSSIKLVQLKESKDTEFDYQIENIQYSDREDPTLNQLKEVIDKLVKETKKLGDNVVVGIQGISIFTRYLEIPRISPKELEVALPIEAKKFIPFPMDEVRLTYTQVAALSKDEKKMGITFVGIPRNQIQRVEKFFTDHKISVKDFETPAFALTRCFKTTRHYRRGETVLIINIGTKYTNLIICRDGGVYFARDIQIGGREITKALIGADAPEYAKAEVKKRTTDLFSKAEHYINIHAVIEEWLKEITDSTDYFYNYLLDTPQDIDRVILTGGGALLGGLPYFLSKKLDRPVLIDSNFSGKTEGTDKEKELSKVAPMLKYAYGLALRAQEESV